MKIFKRDLQIGPKNQVKEIVLKVEEMEEDRFDKNKFVPNGGN